MENKPKYECRLCNYSTHRFFDFNRHKKSTRHNRLKSKNAISARQKVGKNCVEPAERVTCPYCKRVICRKRNLPPHLKVCKVKKNFQDSSEKSYYIDTIKELVDNNKELTQLLLSEKDERMKEKDKKIKEYEKMIRSGNLLQLDDKSKQPTEQKITAKYVKENFTDAYRYDEVMAKSLTPDEIKSINEVGPIMACISLINSRCVENISPDKRPLHCIDNARNRFMVNVAGEWVIDNGGKKILEPIFEKIETIFNKRMKRITKKIKRKQKKRFLKHYEKDNPDVSDESEEDEEEYVSEDLHLEAMMNHEIQMQLGTMRNDKNWTSILTKLRRITLLSNISLKDGVLIVKGSSDTKQIK